LGIAQEKIFPQYKCSRTSKVDLAARFKALEGSSKFSKPDLIIEIKKPSVIFAQGEKRYALTVSQLQTYLAAEKCKSVKYGIIFNGCQVQLFRKHGMLSYPISSVLSLDKKNINGTISYLKKSIKQNEEIRGSIITVWNNKGGVGKTTIAQGLAILLSEKIIYGKKEKNRILLIDYDHNQGDLTANCKMERSDGETKRLLEDEILGKLSKESIINSLPTFTNIPERGTRPRFPFEIKILKADSKLSEEGADYIKNFAAEDRLPLRKLCLQLSELFDYIIIDAPPNYEQSIFSKEAVSAADCILPIALFQNNNSIRNYAKAVIDHIKPAQEKRNDGGPFSLGIWFNRWRTTWTPIPTSDSVKRQIENTEKEEDQIELKRIFYKPNTHLLRKLDENADIARSIMDAKGLPGVVRYLKARNAFDSLVKEFSD
jgi:chromosome partitioning protein